MKSNAGQKNKSNNRAPYQNITLHIKNKYALILKEKNYQLKNLEYEVKQILSKFPQKSEGQYNDKIRFVEKELLEQLNKTATKEYIGLPNMGNIQRLIESVNEESLLFKNVDKNEKATSSNKYFQQTDKTEVNLNSKNASDVNKINRNRSDIFLDEQQRKILEKQYMKDNQQATIKKQLVKKIERANHKNIEIKADHIKIK